MRLVAMRLSVFPQEPFVEGACRAFGAHVGVNVDESGQQPGADDNRLRTRDRVERDPIAIEEQGSFLVRRKDHPFEL